MWITRAYNSNFLFWKNVWVMELYTVYVVYVQTVSTNDGQLISELKRSDHILNIHLCSYFRSEDVHDKHGQKCFDETMWRWWWYQHFWNVTPLVRWNKIQTVKFVFQFNVQIANILTKNLNHQEVRNILSITGSAYYRPIFLVFSHFWPILKDWKF